MPVLTSPPWTKSDYKVIQPVPIWEVGDKSDAGTAIIKLYWAFKKYRLNHKGYFDGGGFGRDAIILPTDWNSLAALEVWITLHYSSTGKYKLLFQLFVRRIIQQIKNTLSSSAVYYFPLYDCQLKSINKAHFVAAAGWHTGPYVLSINKSHQLHLSIYVSLYLFSLITCKLNYVAI